MTGAKLSCTTIVALHWALFPQSSIAVHVLITLYDCGHNPAIVTSKKVTFTVASQASSTVGFPKLGVCPHCIGLTTTGQLMTGAVLSCTVIVCEQLIEFPLVSVAVQVLVIVRSWAHPLTWVASAKSTASAAPQLSKAVAKPVFTGNVFTPQSSVTFTGHIITGGRFPRLIMTV
jgi:hypothetical protein